METFYIIAGASSILSLLVAIITLGKVIKIEKNFINLDISNIKQKLSAKKVDNSDIKQIGRDYNG